MFLTTLIANPSQDHSAPRLKHVSKIYDGQVKFMQMYKKILFIVGSDLEPPTKDFSPKQITVMREQSSQILARLKFNDTIIFFQI